PAPAPPAAPTADSTVPAAPGTAGSAAPATPSPGPGGLRHRRRPYVQITLTVLGLAILAGAGFLFWLKYFNPPVPPGINLTGRDHKIVQAVTPAPKQVRDQPRSAEAWGYLGAVLRAHDFRPESNFCFAQAVRLDPNNYRWIYCIALDQLTVDRDGALPLL